MKKFGYGKLLVEGDVEGDPYPCRASLVSNVSPF
jgi:hypothetical protein